MEHASERLVLFVDASRRVEAVEGDVGDLQAVRKGFGGGKGFGIQDEVEIRFGHGLEVVVCFAGGELADGADANGVEEVEEFASFVDGREEAEQVDGARVFLARREQAADGLADVHHGRVEAFTREGVHVAGADRDVDDRFDFAADAFHVCAEQRVDAGRA